MEKYLKKNILQPKFLENNWPTIGIIGSLNPLPYFIPFPMPWSFAIYWGSVYYWYKFLKKRDDEYKLEHGESKRSFFKRVLWAMFYAYLSSALITLPINMIIAKVIVVGAKIK
jgi:hypothetical protein